MRITSLSNPRIKAAAALKERKERERTGLFLIEGWREIERALAAGIVMLEAYCAPNLNPDEVRVAARLRLKERSGVFELSQPLLKKLSSRENPAGLVVVALVPTPSLAAFQPPSTALVLVSVGLEKPGNLGALLRSADAAGANAVLVSGGVDLYSPQVIHNSTGVVFLLPTFSVSEQAVLDWLRVHQIPMLATTPQADKTYWEVDMRGPVAIVLGPEDQGLNSQWLSQAEYKVRIPMQGHADSLNVSVTAALMLYEAMRQRRMG
jgi:TrmH family RNA methyltransferase